MEVIRVLRVTEGQLAAALDEFVLTVRHGKETYIGRVDNPASVADALFKQLAHDQRDPWADDDTPPAGHVHCDHVPASRAAHELRIADQIVSLIGPHDYDGGRRVKRILRWVWDYLTDGDEPPF